MSHHNYRDKMDTMKCCCHHLSFGIICLISMSSRIFTNVSETLDVVAAQNAGYQEVLGLSLVWRICILITAIGRLCGCLSHPLATWPSWARFKTRFPYYSTVRFSHCSHINTIYVIISLNF